jgi:hypothetical protein
MNLLIIGNGFDRAHDLKTEYSDFLEWAYSNNKMGTYDNFQLNRYLEHRLSYEANSAGSYEYDGFDYNDRPAFLDVLFAKKKSWIDLENNLSSVINGLINTQTEPHNKLLRALFDGFLTSEFESYISSVINLVQIAKKLKLEAVDRVLSFNYSNTYERMYNSKADVCYVNGKAETNREESHIVFGFDYPYNKRNNVEEWSWYDKVFQRAYKNTDSKYKEWLKDSEHSFVYVVGHSLGHTDHDILRPFIKKENSETIIYYHTEESKKQLILRMIEMVGTEFMSQHNVWFRHIDEMIIENKLTEVTFMKRPF